LKDTETTVKELKIAVNEFVHERDWEKYHNPKDIAESICIEAAELLQLFQWIKPEELASYQDLYKEGKLAQTILKPLKTYPFTLRRSAIDTTISGKGACMHIFKGILS
jgi:hypothetical protein